LTSNHDTTIISQTDVEEPTISNSAVEVKTPPGEGIWRTILLGPFVLYHLLTNYNKSDFFATTQAGNTILPVLLMSLLPIPWIIFSTDSPAGKRIRRQRADSSTSIADIYDEVMYRISLVGFNQADRVVLSDETDLINENQKFVVKGGVDCEKVQQLSQNLDLDINYATENNNKVTRLVYVGNMYIHRGIDILFDAVIRCNTDIELVLIGGAPSQGGERPMEEFESYYSKPFEQVVEDLPVECHYKGILEHDAALEEMLNADIGVCILPVERGLPHFDTSYPLKTFEYMATGLPILVTKTQATEDVLTKEQLLTSHDPDDIADQIDRMSNSPELRREACSSNLESVKQHCWSYLWAELDAEIERITGT